MSIWGEWGYWGILGSLIVLLAVFFACMEILYSKAKQPLQGRNGSSTEQGEQASPGGKHAA